MIAAVTADRGYDVTNHEQLLTDLSVYHGRYLDGYRRARKIAGRAGEAPTEALRQALLSYRALFLDLLGSPGDGRRELAQAPAETAAAVTAPAETAAAETAAARWRPGARPGARPAAGAAGHPGTALEDQAPGKRGRRARGPALTDGAVRPWWPRRPEAACAIGPERRAAATGQGDEDREMTRQDHAMREDTRP